MASMKLRVRAASGGPTVRVEIPLLCSLQGLKDVLGPLISLPASSFSLSLNKKDVIQGPGPALLSSFGVTSGDLLFYIVNPGSTSGSFSRPVGIIPSRGQQEVPAGEERSASSAGGARARVSSSSSSSVSASIAGLHEETLRPAGMAVSTPDMRRELCAAAAARRATTGVPQSQLQAGGGGFDGSSDSNLLASAPSASITNKDEGERRGLGESDPTEEGVAMEVEMDGNSPEIVLGGHHFVPIPDLLQRVLASEIGNVRQASAYLVLSVHAVMLETGFVRVDTGNRARVAVIGYGLPSGWSAVGLVNLTYTLPDFTRPSSSSGGRALGEEALLRCQIVGNTVVVYGVVNGGSVHRLSLPVSKFLRENPKFPRAIPDESGGITRSEIAMGNADLPGPSSLGQAAAAAAIAEYENECRDIFGLWKEVKDSLSLPLLTVMCEKAGLPPPPSLLRLPTELKIKVLDSLPSLALASIACACSELRFLAAGEDLWKRRYREEFGASNGESAPGGRGWKSAFVREFEQRRRRAGERREAERGFRREEIFPGIIFRPSFVPPFGASEYSQIGLGSGVGGFGGGFGGGGGGGRGSRRPGFMGSWQAHHSPAASNWEQLGYCWK